MRRESSPSSTSWENVELSICLYPQHQLTNNPNPSSLLLDLTLNKKAPPGINFLPLFLAARQRKEIVFGAIFMDLSCISISTIPSKSPLTMYLGLLPGSIGNLKHLERIDLFNCNFTGSIPKSMEDLTQFVYLEMSSNLFNGAIISIQWENVINLVELHLADNLLEGSIPPSLFFLPLLQELVLSQNRFSGQLDEFSNASSNLATLI
ncbi:receptor-like protein 12 [Pyrus ussuriensis x Pyrus communis]|uniref:Receptor-like protein 12 n=1 Tax=Pyrus ussuriensis x Pyrus communis TaxID=2448454 RepID=A0A5N5H8Z6_9ROSA|nr:receptor-like protein 12 [Pyrus ussuriensis x Pyrus communis]